MTPRLLLSLLLLPLACSETEPEPPRCDYNSGYFSGEPTTSLTIGAIDRETDRFTAWAPDTLVESVRGFQGGYMILPRVAIDAAEAPGESCFLLEVENLPDPDAPDASGELEYFSNASFYEALTEREAGTLLSNQIQDQIGWSPAYGVKMRLRITARGQAMAARGEIDITVGQNVPEACQNLPIELDGCEYELVAGRVEITAIEDPVPGIHDVCPNDGVVVRTSFVPDDPNASACYQEADFPGLLQVEGLGPPRGCLSALGLEEGARFPAVRKLPRMPDRCDPVETLVDVDLSSCSDACSR